MLIQVGFVVGGKSHIVKVNVRRPRRWTRRRAEVLACNLLNRIGPSLEGEIFKSLRRVSPVKGRIEK